MPRVPGKYFLRIRLVPPKDLIRRVLPELRGDDLLHSQQFQSADNLCARCGLEAGEKIFDGFVPEIALIKNNLAHPPISQASRANCNRTVDGKNSPQQNESCDATRLCFQLS
jgi:hypothetical protein